MNYIFACVLFALGVALAFATGSLWLAIGAASLLVLGSAALLLWELVRLGARWSADDHRKEFWPHDWKEGQL